MEFKHLPVMLNECLEALNLKDNGIYVDLTVGGAGHSYEILMRTKNSSLIGVDQDIDAINASKKKLEEFKQRAILVHDNFSNIKAILDNLNINAVDGVLIDLGVSSYQLDNASRGFSFRFDAPLDMRMNKDLQFSAYDVVNNYSVEQLKKVIYDYGEERFASSIARHIDMARKVKPIQTTFELKQIILNAVPRYKGVDGSSNVQRTFQAIRIEVNNELEIIAKTIIDAVNSLKVGGRIAILTFHSLEDRIVKNTFKELATKCKCPPEIPFCVCGGDNAIIKLVNSKPIIASDYERKANPRSASAKLRIAEKIKQNEV